MWKIIETLDFITKLKTKEITYPFYHQHAKSFDKKERKFNLNLQQALPVHHVSVSSLIIISPALNWEIQFASIPFLSGIWYFLRFQFANICGRQSREISHFSKLFNHTFQTFQIHISHLPVVETDTKDGNSQVKLERGINTNIFYKFYLNQS